MEDKEKKEFIGKTKGREFRLDFKIEKLGIKDQVEQLIKNGFDKKDAIKALKKNDNNLEKSIAYLKDGSNTKLRKKEILESIEKLGIKDKIDILMQLGFKLKKAFKVMKNNNYDVEKSKEDLKGKTPKTMNEKYHDVSREELRIKKYLELFPNDKDFDWEKYKEEKKKNRIAKRLEHMNLKNVKDNNKEEREKYKQIEIDPTITTVYIDGNNLFCVDSRIRKLFIGHKIKRAEEKIFLLTFNYFKLLKISQVILVFDNAKKCFVKESDGLKLVVCSANPDFKTSDDALVVWAGRISASDKEKTLFVTSDRGLTDRLIESGIIKIMKSGKFIDTAKNKIGSELFDSFFEEEEELKEDKETKK